MVRDIRATLPHVRTVREARALGVALRRRWSDKRIEGLVRAAGEAMEAAASRPWSSLARALTRGDSVHRQDAKEYDGIALLDRWTKNATSLIRSVRDEVAEGLRKDVLAAIEDGTDPATLAAKWRSEGIPVLFGTLEGRTKVIAQHQMASLNALVQRERAKAVGLEEFVWRSQGDNRVRPAHKALDGHTFTYGAPPEEGLPGQPVNCRCWAETVIPDEMVDALGLRGVYGAE